MCCEDTAPMKDELSKKLQSTQGNLIPGESPTNPKMGEFKPKEREREKVTKKVLSRLLRFFKEMKE